ncbi:hypothetical protein RO3G_13049 [Rhizopus delemar RA 99-880]|uniref:Uncharacterized protein n=1 Tax=Rhizopus delemar (strain RA 99-880 / ATCC MYA-4621 / FGSC 9543 / NRRL 43880) TaxID=246409 RepID=I1CIQ8_RHIO9|nr:hypothetical protein RO3G_13049 [Rhizopus delemar RA 99-880]|eukprot:EIE88338.1 hypothetical protein RO3G_13049 [Rhizopus delemar RA 99-880]
MAKRSGCTQQEIQGTAPVLQKLGGSVHDPCP